MSKQVRNFVAVLIDHHRMHFFDAIVEQLGHELDVRMGFAEAQITSSRDLSDPGKRSIEVQVGKLTGRKCGPLFARRKYSRRRGRARGQHDL